MSRRELSRAVVCALLVLGLTSAHAAPADDANAFYASIAQLADARTPNWQVVIDQLSHIQPAWLDYRFFYHRARAAYAMGEVVAGDNDAAVCRNWAKVLPADEQTKIDHDLSTARNIAVAIASVNRCVGFSASSIHANHVDHDQ